MRQEQRVDRYVRQALAEHDGPDEAAIWLAVFIANEAASSATGYAPPALIEAYRRVRAMEREAEGRSSRDED